MRLAGETPVLRMKRILFITTCFPPTNATGIHRGVALVRHLAACGYEVMVLTMPPAPDMDSDAGLLSKIPAGVQVLRVPMLDVTRTVKRWLGHRDACGPRDAGDPSSLRFVAARTPASRGAGWVDWCSAWLQFPDSRVGWCVKSLMTHRGAVRRFRPDVVYSTAPMWSSHLLAMALRRTIRRPWVADCRDPWRANPFRVFRHRSHAWMDANLEGMMVRRASAVICNTPGVRRDFVTRYPRAADKFVAIPNGFDASEVSEVRASPRPANGHLRLVHAGVFYGTRSPAALLEALAALAAEDAAARNEVRLMQVGPADFEGRPLAELAGRFGVADMLELTGPLSHRAALRAVYEGDVAVAVSQTGAHGDLQVPRKFYEYYGLGRRVLATGGCCGAIRELFDGVPPAGVRLIDEPTVPALTSALRETLGQWRRGELRDAAEATMDFSETRMTRDIERTLETAANSQ